MSRNGNSHQQDGPSDAMEPVTNRIFASALLDPDIAIPDGITDAEGKAAPKRYSVYRNNVVVSLMDSLGDAYPALKVIIGEENFGKICRNYVVETPPNSAMMQNYGENFAGFIENFPPLAKSPFLGDVARVERAWLESYHAMDAEVLTGAVLEGLEPEAVQELVFQPHPALRLITSDWPVLDLFGWRDGRPDDGVDLSKSQSIAITRPELDVQLWPIDHATYHLFSALANGSTLGEAAGEVMGEFEEFDLSAALALALNAGVFSSDLPTEDGQQN